MLPDEALLSCIIMLNAIVLVIDGGTAHIGRCCACGSARTSADDFRFQMVYCQSLSPPYYLFLFLFRKRESRAIIFDSPCLCDKAAGGRFSQAEGEVYRSLRADNGDRCPQARRHCLALSAESAIRLAERAPDATRQYHHLPCGQVVSKCALREKRKRSAPVPPERPNFRHVNFSCNISLSSSKLFFVASG